eukprot:5778676-Pyramimonas_sp.AAC.1
MSPPALQPCHPCACLTLTYASRTGSRIVNPPLIVTLRAVSPRGASGGAGEVSGRLGVDTYTRHEILRGQLNYAVGKDLINGLMSVWIPSRRTCPHFLHQVRAQAVVGSHLARIQQTCRRGSGGGQEGIYRSSLDA